MAQCQAGGKKHPTGAIDLYAGVFKSDLHISNGGNNNIDRYHSWSRYNAASNYNTPVNDESYRKEITLDRTALQYGSFREGQTKSGTSTNGNTDGSNLKSGSYNNGSIHHAGAKCAIQSGGLVMGADKLGCVLNGFDSRNGNNGALAVGSSPMSNGVTHQKDSTDVVFSPAPRHPNGELWKSAMKPASETSSSIGPPLAGVRTSKPAEANGLSPNHLMGSRGSPNGSSYGSLMVGGGAQGDTASNSGSSNGGSPTAEASRGGRPFSIGNIMSNGGSATSGSVRGIGNIVGSGGSAQGSMITGNLGSLKPPLTKPVSYDSHPPSTPATLRGSTPRNSGEMNSNGVGGSSKAASTPRVSNEGSFNGGIITGSNPGSAAKAAKGSSISPIKANTGGASIPNVGNISRSNWNGKIFNGGNLSNGAANKGGGKVDGTIGNVHSTGSLSNGSSGSNGNALNTGNSGNGLVSKGNGKGDTSRNGAESFGPGNIHLAGESILMKRVLSCTDPEDVKNAGNEQYKKGHFSEALSLYDKAIALSPSHAPYRGNRAAALAGLGRLAEAVQECEEAIKLDQSYARAHQRAASLYLRLGLVESTKCHFQAAGQLIDWGDNQRLQIIEKHISRCIESRKAGDWKAVIKESDAAVVAGADSAPQIFGYKAEALLKLNRPKEADVVLSAAERVESSLTKPRVTSADSFLFVVRTQIDLALGRFEGAMVAAESAARIDPRSTEISALLRKARAVGHARISGNDLFKAGRFFEACASYGEGLESDPMNAVLLCNRAACRSKLGQWEKAVEDCNAALNVQPNYTKALMRRANCNAKLERWEDALRDYEVLRAEMPGDMEVARGHFDVQVAIKKSRGEEIYKMKFGGEVEEVSSNDQFREAVTSPGLSVVQFNTRWSDRCRKMSPFIDKLCKFYPSVNFIKVDVDDNPYLAKTESVSFVPTFKIYKNGLKVKEILGPSEHELEYAVKHYSL